VTIGPDHFRNVPDWPKPGIQFKDIGPVLADAQLLSEAISALVAAATQTAGGIDFVIAPEARGFLFGPTLASQLGAGFIPARKPSKLPPETHSTSYELEYGEDHLHIAHGDLSGRRVLIHDDLLATGGTAAALARLISQVGAVPVGAVFLSELVALNGRAALEGIPVASVVRFED
jgi:adenine phosphoribosyltransferase